MKKVYNIEQLKYDETLIRLLKEVWKDGSKKGKAHHSLSHGDIIDKYMPDFKKRLKEQETKIPKIKEEYGSGTYVPKKIYY